MTKPDTLYLLFNFCHSLMAAVEFMRAHPSLQLCVRACQPCNMHVCAENVPVLVFCSINVAPILNTVRNVTSALSQRTAVCGQMVKNTVSFVCNKSLLIVCRLDQCPIPLQLSSQPLSPSPHTHTHTHYCHLLYCSLSFFFP